MCGRVVQASGPDQLGLRTVNSFEGPDRRGGNVPPRYNAAPSQELYVIRQHPQTGERTLDLLKWGLVAALVAVAIITALGTMKNSLVNTFTKVSTELNNANTSN